MFINATTRQQISIYSIGPYWYLLACTFSLTFGKMGVQKLFFRSFRSRILFCTPTLKFVAPPMAASYPNAAFEIVCAHLPQRRSRALQISEIPRHANIVWDTAPRSCKVTNLDDCNLLTGPISPPTVREGLHTAKISVIPLHMPIPFDLHACWRDLFVPSHLTLLHIHS